MTRTRRLMVSLALNIALATVQVFYGLAAHSMGLLADAGHNVTDVAALGLSMVAVRLALRPRSAARSFGNHRATILAALANAAAITAVTVVIVFESIRRFGQPEPVHAGIVVIVAAAALVANGLAAMVLHDGSSDLNMRAALIHMLGDALASLAVLVAAAILIVVPAAVWLDPASALVVAGIILYEAVIVLRSSVLVLLESTPADVDLPDLTSAMTGVAGVDEVHDLHVWSLSSELRVLSAHLVLTGHPTLEQAHAVGEQVKQRIAVPFSIAHSTLELECERCIDRGCDPCLMESLDTGVSEATAGHHH